jgi:hypothetical protein
VRGSSWATDWPKAVRGLHELAHAADRPLRKGGGLRFLPAQEKQESERNAVSKCGQNRHGHRSGRSRVLPAASRCAVPLRLATLASGEPRSEKHSHTRMGLREYPSMREHQEIISREHIRGCEQRATLGKGSPHSGQPISNLRPHFAASGCTNSSQAKNIIRLIPPLGTSPHRAIAPHHPLALAGYAFSASWIVLTGRNNSSSFEGRETNPNCS